MSLINDLNRLDRAGSEHSRSSEKLKDACRSLADHISDEVIGFPCSLPDRGADDFVFQSYSVVKDENGNAWFAVDADVDGQFVEGFKVIVREWDRDQNLAFAKDVANGLLPAISKWLEERTEEADRFTDIVNTEADK